MMYFTIVFLCTAGLFMTLLEDRFRIWTTVGVNAAAYLLSLLAAFAIRRLTADPVLATQLPCIAGSLIFFVSSLFIYTNNILDKLFTMLMTLCNFTFLSFFVPLFLGVLPFSTAGAFAGIFSVAAYFIFSMLIGACLYRPLKHFCDRGVSGFMVGMCFAALVLYAFSMGWLDFLFKANFLAARLLTAVIIYAVIIFAFRSVYHAGRFRQASAAEAERSRMLEMESGDFADMLAAVREVRSAQKAGEYALETVGVMLKDGRTDELPAYLAAARRKSAESPILESYHENPYISAVIATKSAFAAQNGIVFECNAVTGSCPLKTAELCVIVNEMLTKACNDAAEFDGSRRVRFTAFPDEHSLKLEAVYSATLPEKEKFTVRGKKLSDIWEWLFDDEAGDENVLHGLENTEEIMARYSGKLTVSASGEDEVILQAGLLF